MQENEDDAVTIFTRLFFILMGFSFTEIEKKKPESSQTSKYCLLKSDEGFSRNTNIILRQMKSAPVDYLHRNGKITLWKV